MWGSFPNPPCVCFALPTPGNCSLLPLWKLLLILMTLLLGTLQLPSNTAAKSTALDFLKDREPPSHKLALTGTYHSVCHRAHNQVTAELPHPSSWSNSAGKGRFVLLLCGISLYCDNGLQPSFKQTYMKERNDTENRFSSSSNFTCVFCRSFHCTCNLGCISSWFFVLFFFLILDTSFWQILSCFFSQSEVTGQRHQSYNWVCTTIPTQCCWLAEITPCLPWHSWDQILADYGLT